MATLHHSQFFRGIWKFASIFLCVAPSIVAFNRPYRILRRLASPRTISITSTDPYSSTTTSCSFLLSSARRPQRSLTSLAAGHRGVSLDFTAGVRDDQVDKLFAWVSKAWEGDERYNNLVWAIAAIFGDLPADSPILVLLEDALKDLPTEEALVGAPFSLRERESASLGAMGAAQWLGQWRTRPHALLDLRPFKEAAAKAQNASTTTTATTQEAETIQLNDNDAVQGSAASAANNNAKAAAKASKKQAAAASVAAPTDPFEAWRRSLPRGAKRTLAKADAQDFSVQARPIRGGQPAPHSSLAHFRCVVAHEVRLLASNSEADGGTNAEEYLNALAEACGRYMGTTRMAGEVREYRDKDNKVVAFAHEVRKGAVVRGQWFYATDEAAKNYVWFHSVQDLVRRAMAAEGIDVCDLGPSGSDAFSDLKAKYGFVSVEDWPAVADYEKSGFWHADENDNKASLQNVLLEMMAAAMR